MSEAVTSSAEPEETVGRLGALDTARVVMVFCVIAFFLNFPCDLSPFTGVFASVSYGMYWLHQIILMPILYLMLDIDLPSGVKFAVGVLGTILICLVLTRRVLMKIPVRIFWQLSVCKRKIERV